MARTAPLPSWRDGKTRQAILDFVSRVTDESGTDFVPAEERVAVFDNDGTLWTEKPMPIELMFILQRWVEMAEKDEKLRTRQPWKAAYTKDYAWLGNAFVKHYQGDDSDVKLVIGGVLQAFAGWTVDEYTAAGDSFLHTAQHPGSGRALTDCGFTPMRELLDYLRANDFTTYIASGGTRDFMRSISLEMYGISSEQVIGSSNGIRYEDEDGNGQLVLLGEMDVFDDGPIKPVRIWSRTGRRPILAGGNANGDLPMLKFAGGGGRPSLRLLVLHDDAEREADYVAGAEKVLEHARKHDWTIVSLKNDWETVF